MKIQKFYGVEGATKAKGFVVIVDVLRAASTVAYAFSKGAKCLIPVSTKEEAFELQKRNPDYLLMGEENGIKITNFDFGNSPSEILKSDLNNKILIFRTTNGVQGILNAKQADDILLGGFIITSAIENYVIKNNPSFLPIVAMDGADSEDGFFADYLEKRLSGELPNFDAIVDSLKTNPNSLKFLDPNCPEFPEEDFHLSLTLDRFDFVNKVEKDGNQLLIRKIIP
jgi:2-phosphosulfolactate phosphatase